MTPKFRHRIRKVKDRHLELVKRKQKEELEDALFGTQPEWDNEGGRTPE